MNNSENNFANFDLDAEHKVLRRGGEIVPLPPKAVELLVVLVKNRGEVVSKNELLELSGKERSSKKACFPTMSIFCEKLWRNSVRAKI